MAASLEFSSVAEFRTAAGDHVQESGRNDQQKLQIPQQQQQQQPPRIAHWRTERTDLGMGGGTLDVSLLTIEGGIFEVKATPQVTRNWEARTSTSGLWISACRSLSARTKERN